MNRYPQASSFYDRWAQAWARRYNERFAPKYDIYLFHRIHPSANTDNLLNLKTSPDNFEKQIIWLKKNKEILPLRQLVKQLGNISTNQTSLTFDDGYLDNYTYAFPIIKEHKIPITIFLSTFWVGNLQRMLCDQIDLCAKKKNMDPNKVSQTGWRLRHLLREERLTLLKHQYGYDPTWETKMTDDQIGMNWDMINEMIDSGLVQFEVHGHQHLSCRHLSTEQFEHEILLCKELLLKNTGTDSKIFAYPFGSEDDVHALCPSWLESLGFEAAFLAMGQSNHKMHSPFLLDRTQTIPT